VDDGWTRRSLLTAAVAGLGLGATAACGIFDREPPDPPVPDPLEPLLAGTIALADRYDATIAAQPTLATRLTPLRDAHRTHATELARLIGKPLPSASAATPSPGPSEAAAVVAALRTAEQQAQKAAADACLAAPAKRAPVLGSIAAGRATHVEVLG
jgi:hypothetical protein